jgi:hypothetical protein
MRALTAVAFVCGLTAFLPQAIAQRPVALVEDVSDGVKGVDILDYVAEGQTITLAAGQKIVLSYLGSCRRETVTGGTLTVGPQQSQVKDGQVSSEAFQCDRGALRLAAAQAGQSGAAAIRVAPPAIPGVLPNPELTIRSIVPVIKLSQPTAITIERMDKPGAPVQVAAGDRVIDLSKRNIKLEKGGLYRIIAGDKRLVVKVHNDARGEPGAVADRLVIL